MPNELAERALAWTATLTVALLFSAIGCGSASPTGADGGTGATGGTGASGGTGATGGTSGTQGLGGSGGSGGSGGTGGGMPNPPAAGLTITLTEPSVADGSDLAGRTCNLGSGDSLSYALGAPAPGGTLPDGMDGVTVNCSVALGADGTSMDVVASVGGADETSGEAIEFSVESAMIQSRDGAPAFITFASETMGHLSPIEDCTLGPFATLKSGAMLADFTCTLLGSPDDPTIGCRAHGTLGVEYCQTGN